jgi:hypothetical protein
MAVVAARVGQTAMPVGLEPRCAAACHDCAAGSRPPRAAPRASEPRRADLARRAGAVVAMDCQRSLLSMPPGTRLRLVRPRVRDGRLRWRRTHSLQAGGLSQGQSTPTTAGGSPGAPRAPWSSPISLHLLEQGWPSRGEPTTLGASRPRYADAAILGCRRHAAPARHACEAMVARLDLIINRTKTRLTKGTEGVDSRGFHGVRRRRPTSGQRPLDLCPRQAGQRRRRRRSKDCTTRHAPGPPETCVRRLNAAVEGWGKDARHTKARQAFRALQRFMHPRLRRYLTSRRQGRGGGWKPSPNSRLYAMGITHMGSGRIRYPSAPAHAL